MKNYKTFVILNWISFICPLGRWYIGTHKKLVRTLTLNWLGIAWFTDLFYQRKHFDEAMTKRGFVNSNIRNIQNK